MNFTAGNLTAIKLDVGTALTRNSRTFHNPIVGLLLAAGILARVAQAKQNAATSLSAALTNPWLQHQSVSSGAAPVQIVPSQSGVQPPYGYYPPPYPLAAQPGAYPWWYAMEPFSFYPINGEHAQVIHEHEEHKDGISYPEDHEEGHGHEEHHHNSHEIHSAEVGDQSAPGSYESESENSDKQVASNEIPIPPNNEIKPVEESVEESKLEPVVIQTVDKYPSATSSTTESSLEDAAVLPTAPNSPLNSTLINEATRTVQNIVGLLRKFEGNYSRIKTAESIKQRPNNHQLVLEEQQYALPKNSVTNILVQLNTTSASDLLPDGDDRIAEASDMSLVQLEGSPLILAMAGAAQTVRRQHRPNDAGKQPPNGRKGTTTTRRPSNNKTHNRQRPQQRKPTTPRPPVVPVYDDDEYEYEYTTPRYKPTRRSTTRRKPDYRRPTPPPRRYHDYDFDNYQMRTQTPPLNRRKQGSVNIYNKNRNNYNNRMKPISMSAYDDDFDDGYNDDPSQYYSNDDYGYRPAQAQAQIDYADYRNDKDHDGNGFVARQGGNTEAPDYEDESTTESVTSTIAPTPATTVPTTQPSTSSDTPTPAINVTISPIGYPYGPGSNTSFTYGPPVHPHQPGYGYGPSNGNENISITYGPPTAGGETGGASGTGGGGTGGGSSQQYIAAGGPSLDWYNQYAKQNVFKRIQDLLTPNNFYSPQYDSDKYNYNDNTF